MLLHTLINNSCYASIALAPFTWDTAPSLDSYHRVFVDPALKNKTDQILPVENAKMSENQTSEKRSTTENIEAGRKIIEIKPINEIALAIRNAFHSSSMITTPRNVILLLVDERSRDEEREENSWNGVKKRLPFAIEGFLQVLSHNRINHFYISDNFIRLISDKLIFLSLFNSPLFNNYSINPYFYESIFIVIYILVIFKYFH